ncbi:MAG: periplasmic heavy metal sensor [Candidatus Aminicenantes bacterium]|nr:periplasmic heavy metal sensor [Candidatus Aminicenantes bacterium]
MTQKRIFRVLALAAFVAMAVIAPLQAARGCQMKDEPGMMRGKGCMMLQRLPGLSDEQKAKLEKLHAEHQKLMAAATADMKKLAEELQALMKDPVDVRKAEAKIDEMAKMKGAMQKKCLAHRLAVRVLLTGEHKAKLDSMGCGMGIGMAGAMMHGQGGRMSGCRVDRKRCKMKEAMRRGCNRPTEKKAEQE